MLTGLWTIGFKVPNLERELAFHKQIGNELLLDERLEIEGELFRIVLAKMGDKYLHLAEKTVYEKLMGKSLPYGLVHLVYLTDDFDGDAQKFLAAGAEPIREPVEVSAGFGERKVAFFLTPSGWVCEIAKIYRHGVPEV
jgi:hypothetical protein